MIYFKLQFNLNKKKLLFQYSPVLHLTKVKQLFQNVWKLYNSFKAVLGLIYGNKYTPNKPNINKKRQSKDPTI